MHGKAILIVLDGFGIGKESPFNAIQNARMPFYNDLIKKYPHSELLTHGQAVGLPDGVMGNSEVGHMTMGAGRTIYQDLTRISNDIKNKSFFKNELLKKTIQSGRRIHFMGLLSDGGVHSHIEHLEALLDLACEIGHDKISIHLFMDGRDTPPDSGVAYIERLLSHSAIKTGKAQIASISGRYYAMDRDQRWDRVEKAYLAMTGQTSESVEKNPLQILKTSYQNKITDEFIEPTCLDKAICIQDGDSVLFFNYRSDRAREISSALTSKDFSFFNRSKKLNLTTFTGMTVYDKNLGLPAIYGPQNLNNILGSLLEYNKLKQFRLAETEKYAHVTFFFNGGRELPYEGEERKLIASPRDVATYDLKPEMSALEVAETAKTQIELLKSDFILMNFANADMVGHTGNYLAAVKAIETLDTCLAKVIGAAEKNGYHTLLTADHGNAESMCDDEGKPHTQHTLNPVPALWVQPGSAQAPKKERLSLLDGTLADIMPTLCNLMNLTIPSEVTGKNLIPKEFLK